MGDEKKLRWEDLPESNMDVVNEDTPVTFFSGTTPGVDEDGDPELVAEFKSFTVTSKLKKVMLEEISMAMAENYMEPFIILLPSSDLDVVPENFTYPFIFKGHKVYVVPYIKGIMVFENE